MERTIDRRTLLTGAAVGAAALAAPGIVKAAAPERRASASPVTLTWGWWSNGPTKDAAYKAWLQEFEKANPSIKIQAEILPWASYWDKLRTTLAGGNAYDVIGMASGQVTQYMANDLFVDLSTLSGYGATANALNAQTRALYSWNSKQYALPTGIALWVMGYNKTLFTKAGVPFPDPVKPMTFTQLKAVAKKLTIVNGKNTVQFGIAPAAILDWNELIEMEGGQVYDRTNNPTKMLLNSAAGIRGLADFQSMYTEGITPSVEHIADFAGGYIGALQTGKIAIAALGPWDFGTIIGGKLPYGIAPSPSIKSPVLDSTANAFGIFKGSKNVDAAWTFIKWALNTQNELGYATFSDIPSNTQAFARMGSVVKPANFVQTLQAQVHAYRPSMQSTNPNLVTTLTNITQDLARGKLTPAKAAAQMESQGNDQISQQQ